MKNEWISRQEAIAALGIKPQTLYAYVSRGLIRTAKDARDSRRSLYDRRDIDTLVLRQKKPRARADVAAGTIAWGEPVLESRISTVRDGALIFGDTPAVDLAQTLTLEQAAAHHWQADVIRSDALRAVVPSGGSARERGFIFLAKVAATAPPCLEHTDQARLETASALLFGFAGALIGTPCEGRIHDDLARSWGLDTQASDTIRQILVLMSDHELNASTFAVRVAVSTGASLAAAALAGYSAFSGPLHGDAGRAARTALQDVMHSKNETSLDGYCGFGHPMYPHGDDRARHIIDIADLSAPIRAALSRLESRTQDRPNSDAAIAAFALDNNLPDEAGFVIFAMARLAGWMAHAFEQIETGALIRPRARFVL